VKDENGFEISISITICYIVYENNKMDFFANFIHRLYTLFLGCEYIIATYCNILYGTTKAGL